MSKVEFDAKELAKIIKACRLAGVAELKIGEMEIKFAPGDAARTLVTADETVVPPTDKELEKIESDLREGARLDRADDELALMQVEDPVQFEELLVQRELEPSGGSTEDFANDR